jgi:ribosome-interacting GTPase 1
LWESAVEADAGLYRFAADEFRPSMIEYEHFDYTFDLVEVPHIAPGDAY